MDLGKAPGSGEPASLQKLSLYLPERDRAGALVPDIEKWIEAALSIFGEINGGATRLPVAQGYWKPPQGDPVREPTNVVYSFIRDERRFEANLERLVRFIHSFGKHANQGEVMVEFSGEVPRRGFVSRAYFIDKYPKAGAKPFQAARVTVLPSSKRRRFSSSTFIEKGRRSTLPSCAAAFFQTVISVGAAADVEGGAGVEAVVADGGHGGPFSRTIFS